MTANEIALAGKVTAIEPLRYSPAGVPLLCFKLLHRSSQLEAGLKRQVECEMSGVAMAEVAVTMSRLSAGQAVKVSGFLNRKNRMSAQLILHAATAEIL